jgi:hypothetical protein
MTLVPHLLSKKKVEATIRFHQLSAPSTRTHAAVA